MIVCGGVLHQRESRSVSDSRIKTPLKNSLKRAREVIKSTENPQ